MASNESSPPRPASVPDGAYWDASDNEWVLPQRNAAGAFHGIVTWYRPDGTRCCVTEHVDGKPHGTFTRYHENGEPSRVGTFVEGTLTGTNVFTRSTAPTTEKFPDGLGAHIWRCEMDFDDGGEVEDGRLFDRDGQRVREDGSPYVRVRPAAVPEDAVLDDELAQWIQAGDTERRYWDCAGVLRQVDTLAGGLLVRMREYLADGSLAQDTTVLEGDVPQRKYFRRTEAEALDSFPSITRQHPTAMEVEYTFDAHGLMSGFVARDGSGAELERTEVYRNAHGAVPQAKFASIEEASRAWIAAGDTYTAQLNKWIAELYASDDPPDWDEPTFEREDLERAVLGGVEALNASGQGARARELFPLYYDGIGRAFWDRYGLVVDRVLDLGSETLARLRYPTQPPGVVRIAGERAEPMAGLVAFGASADKRYVAYAFEDRIEIRHGVERIALAYPSSYQHAGADALDTALGLATPMGVSALHVAPNGRDVVVVSAEGIFAVSPDGFQRLYPDDATLDTYVERFEEDGAEGETFELDLGFANADLAPAGDRIACGAMFAQGLTDQLAIFKRGAAGWELEVTSSDDAFFPAHAVFHRTRPHLAFAATMHASLHHDGIQNTTFRIDLDDLAPGELTEFSGGVCQMNGRVTAIASFGKGFLLGFDNGYIRWMGVDENCQLLGHVFAGGTINAIDVSADGQSFTTGSDAGLVSRFTLREGGAPAHNLVATMPVSDDSRVAFFRTFPPLRW